MVRRSLVLAFVLAAVAVAGAPAGSAGAESANGRLTYTISRVGPDTLVRATLGPAGKTVGTQRLKGAFRWPRVVPGVAEGISHDRSTVVLQGGVGATGSSYAVLDGALTRPARLVRLVGRFEYDALSPDGRMLFLTQMLPGTDDHYLVRAYDLVRNRLQAEPVLEKGEEAEPMAGYAVARVSSADGGWVFTLYRGGHAGPFVHALWTRNRVAACIDLRPRDARERPTDRLWRLRVSPDGMMLTAFNPKTAERVLVDLSQGWPVRAS